MSCTCRRHPCNPAPCTPHAQFVPYNSQTVRRGTCAGLQGQYKIRTPVTRHNVGHKDFLFTWLYLQPLTLVTKLKVVMEVGIFLPPLDVGHRMSFEVLHVADSTMYFYSVHEHVKNSTSLKETVYKPANSLLLLYYLLHACKVLRFINKRLLWLIQA